MTSTFGNLPALFTSNVHPVMSSLTETIKRIIIPDSTSRGTKWRWSFSLALLSILTICFYVLQVVTMDVYLNRLMSKAWFGFLAWDAASVLLLVWVFLWQRNITITRPVEWMRYVWLFVMANQVVKLCVLYRPLRNDLPKHALYCWETPNSITLSAYLSVLVLAGMLYWSSGSSVRYEHVQSWSMLSYIMSVADLMDALDLFGYYKTYLGSADLSLSNAIRFLLVVGSLCSPFFALTVVSEANGTGALQPRLTQMSELHLVTSSWLFNFPAMIVRLYIYFTRPSVAISVFLSKNFIIWCLNIFQPVVAFGKEVR